MTVGQALAALPGPADLKEFVFLLFFQKQKRKKELQLHMFPLTTRVPPPQDASQSLQ